MGAWCSSSRRWRHSCALELCNRPLRWHVERHGRLLFTGSAPGHRRVCVWLLHPFCVSRLWLSSLLEKNHRDSLCQARGRQLSSAVAPFRPSSLGMSLTARAFGRGCSQFHGTTQKIVALAGGYAKIFLWGLRSGLCCLCPSLSLIPRRFAVLFFNAQSLSVPGELCLSRVLSDCPRWGLGAAALGGGGIHVRSNCVIGLCAGT